MRKAFLISGFIAAAALAVFVTSAAAPANFAGTWSLDKAKSTGLSSRMQNADSVVWTITQDGKTVGRLGVFSVPDPKLLAKRGANPMSYPDIERSLKASDAQLRNEALEQANCEPTTELAALMDAQRQLEANANMIRYQDQMLSRLVNDVAKIG